MRPLLTAVIVLCFVVELCTVIVILGSVEGVVSLILMSGKSNPYSSRLHLLFHPMVLYLYTKRTDRLVIFVVFGNVRWS